MSLLVYAIASPSPRRISITGITGERLRRVRVGRLDAIVSAPRAVPLPSDQNLRAHDRTMSALWKGLPAVLPVRFGTIVDESQLAHILVSRETAIRTRLREVRGRGQMTVRVPLVSSAASNPKAQIPGPKATGAEYLRGRAREMRDVPGFDPVRDSVRRWVKREHVEKRAGVATVYHLVPIGSVARYRKALEAAARGTDLRLTVTGPWPPYAFAEEAI